MKTTIVCSRCYDDLILLDYQLAELYKDICDFYAQTSYPFIYDSDEHASLINFLEKTKKAIISTEFDDENHILIYPTGSSKTDFCFGKHI